jgi:hypothetical protein
VSGKYNLTVRKRFGGKGEVYLFIVEIVIINSWVAENNVEDGNLV